MRVIQIKQPAPIELSGYGIHSPRELLLLF